MKKNTFFFNPNNKESFNVYNNKNAKDTIPIKYSNITQLTNTIKKLEILYKSNQYSHKRISQVAMIIRVRLQIIKDKNPKIDKGKLSLATKYTDFLKNRTKLPLQNRKQYTFKL